MRKKKILTAIAVVGSGLFSVGCSTNKNLSDIEKVVYTTLKEDEVVKIVETPNSEKKDLKDVEITLNLEKMSKSVIYEKSLEISTALLNNLNLVFGDSIENYTFLINTTKLDIYGNLQKVKALKVEISRDVVKKINFSNFDYLNLDKICDVTKFKYLTQAENEYELNIKPTTEYEKEIDELDKKEKLEEKTLTTDVNNETIEEAIKIN